MRVLVTGGCGFIGSHFIRRLLEKNTITKIFNLDLLTYSGHIGNLSDIDDDRYQFVHGSINNNDLLKELIFDQSVNIVVNFAAESHVDRSIHSVGKFIETNVQGTGCILDAIVHSHNSGRRVDLVHVSTDEVYGSLGPQDDPFTEKTPLDPKNPYAASKASSDLLVLSYVNTHSISACITRCSNNYGPNQFPEKLIPLMTLNCLQGKKLPIYGDGMQIRDWINVKDHVDGIISIVELMSEGVLDSGEIINFGANNERTNLEIVEKIIEISEAGGSEIEYVRDRPGHDRRYAMGYEKAGILLGWEPKVDWESGINETVLWYKENTEWIESINTNQYREWIDSQYGSE